MKGKMKMKKSCSVFVPTVAAWLLGPALSYGSIVVSPPPGSSPPSAPVGSFAGLSVSSWTTGFGATIGSLGNGAVYADFFLPTTATVSENDVATKLGATYQLTFSVLGGSTTASLEALWNGTAIGSVDFTKGPYSSWTTFTYSFTGTGTPGTLSFSGHDDGPPYIGGVGVNAVPEPGTALAGAGALVLGCLGAGSLRSRSGRTKRS